MKGDHADSERLAKDIDRLLRSIDGLQRDILQLSRQLKAPPRNDDSALGRPMLDLAKIRLAGRPITLRTIAFLVAESTEQIHASELHLRAIRAKFDALTNSSYLQADLTLWEAGEEERKG